MIFIKVNNFLFCHLQSVWEVIIAIELMYLLVRFVFVWWAETECVELFIPVFL